MTRAPLPIFRGQGNRPFEKEDAGQNIRRGQEVPYNVNGAPAGGDADTLDGQDGTFYLARGNHTGTQSAATISDLTESVQDLVGAMAVAGTGISISYDDPAGTLTISVSGLTSANIGDFAEAVDDRVAALLVAGANISLSYNDAANTLTVAVTGLASIATSGSASDLVAGTIPAARMPAFSGGDVTSAAGGLVLTIGNDVVTYAKMQNVSATDRVIGRQTAGAGDAEEITFTSQARQLCDDTSFAGMRVTLGLGSIATQNANAVAITGGTADLTSGAGVSPFSATGPAAKLIVDFAGGGSNFYDGASHNFRTNAAATLLTISSTLVTSQLPIVLKGYTVAGLPSAATAAQLVYVSNESGGAQPAFSDGTNWRRVTDRAIVS